MLDDVVDLRPKVIRTAAPTHKRIMTRKEQERKSDIFKTKNANRSPGYITLAWPLQSSLKHSLRLDPERRGGSPGFCSIMDQYRSLRHDPILKHCLT